MDFTWKAAKRTSNLKKHGFDFADAKQVFNGPTSTEEDARDYDGDGRANRTTLRRVIREELHPA